METKETQCHPKPLVNATCLLGEKGCYENGKCYYIGNCEHKVLTNADRIRGMGDELLATQLVQVIIETVKILTDLEMPDDLANEIRANVLKKLQQPAEGE